MLDAQGVVDLLLKLDVRVDFVRHGNYLREGSKCGAGRQRRLTKPPHTGGETHGIFRTLAVSVSALLHFYFDCFWLRHRAFRQVNLQHAETPDAEAKNSRSKSA